MLGYRSATAQALPNRLSGSMSSASSMKCRELTVAGQFCQDIAHVGGQALAGGHDGLRLGMLGQVAEKQLRARTLSSLKIYLHQISPFSHHRHDVEFRDAASLHKSRTSLLAR